MHDGFHKKMVTSIEDYSLETVSREVRWIRGPRLDQTQVSLVRTQPDGPSKRLGEL